MSFTQLGPANQAFHKTHKRIQSKREQKQQLAKKIAIKNELLQKHNFHFILSDSQMLKESNLPFTQMQYMQIIESKRGSVGFLGGDRERTQGADQTIEGEPSCGEGKETEEEERKKSTVTEVAESATLERRGSSNPVHVAS